MSNSIINGVTSTDATIDLITELDKPQPPSMYHVVMLNDDFTPMGFVVAILMDVFHKTPEQAKDIMLQVHHEKRGIAGTYTKEIAQEKSDRTKQIARASDFPLNCIIEAVE